MRTWSPGTQVPGVSSSDPPWTPGQWREEESDGSADESTPYPLKVGQIASLTDMKTVEQLTFRLASDWESASANEKALCEEKFDEACQAVCKDVFYGTRTLKLDSGEQLVMPNVVRTVARSTMIAQYFSHCRDEEFEPLGRSTLFQILKVRESSQRKSLQGLDNTAASGADGFDALNKIIDRLEESGSRPEWCQATRKELKEGKRYLKTEYRAHCREGESPCPDYCGRYALSDPQSTDFQASCDHEHYTQCQQCESLKNAMISILIEIESPD
ncbi:hypothetical protein ACROYT_G022814 [Oculina patagonica]